MLTNDANSKKMVNKKRLINDVTSEKMAKEISKESLPLLFAKLLQSLEHYDKTNTLPQFVSNLFFDIMIRRLVNFRNKLYTDTSIIDLEFKNE